eukprot:scaffold283268_cov33-Tisochrysis_lutea.AAC.1
MPIPTLSDISSSLSFCKGIISSRRQELAVPCHSCHKLCHGWGTPPRRGRLSRMHGIERVPGRHRLGDRPRHNCCKSSQYHCRLLQNAQGGGERSPVSDGPNE